MPNLHPLNKTKYHFLFLVGVDQFGNQQLIKLRYYDSPYMVIQMVNEKLQPDGTIKTTYSDMCGEHHEKMIAGGVPDPISQYSPTFTYNRETLALLFTLEDGVTQVNVFTDTALPFIEKVISLCD